MYWRERFKCVPLDHIIPSISMTEVNKKYFLISSVLKEDKKLRHKLKLENALKVQEIERNDESYKRSCLFCKLQFEGTFLYFEIISKNVRQRFLLIKKLEYYKNEYKFIYSFFFTIVDAYCYKIINQNNFIFITLFSY